MTKAAIVGKEDNSIYNSSNYALFVSYNQNQLRDVL